MSRILGVMLALSLQPGMTEAATPTAAVWVYFRDKGPQAETRMAEAHARLSPRA